MIEVKMKPVRAFNSAAACTLLMGVASSSLAGVLLPQPPYINTITVSSSTVDNLFRDAALTNIQTFTFAAPPQPGANNIAGAGILFGDIGNIDQTVEYTLKIGVYTYTLQNGSFVLSANALTSGSLSSKNIGNNWKDQWVEIGFTPYSLTQGGSYALKFDVTSFAGDACLGSNGGCITFAGAGSDTAYAGGAGYGQLSSGGAIEPLRQDFMFSTYALATSVPEPGTWLLMLSGFGLLARARRRA